MSLPVMLAVLPQTILTLSVEGAEPVRFGFPVPAEALERGLRLQGEPGARLQWRLLQRQPDPRTDRCWVELAMVGARDKVRVMAGGRGPDDNRDGPVYRYVAVVQEQHPRRVRRERWEWVTGEVDRRVRTTFLQQTRHESGEDFESGEALTEHGPDWAARWRRVRIAPRSWRRAGVLPKEAGLGREVRARLAEAAHAMVELPGLRGRGDYGRSDGVVTNLEYDTALALARMALCGDDPELLAKAHRAARHLVDRDLDPRSGLPFRHGQGHRTGRPEPGHAWLQGLLLVGGRAADDDLLFAARTIAGALGRNPPKGKGPTERARDYAWPLLELEAWLAFADDPPAAVAADRLALAILARFDQEHRLFRFGEGEGRRSYQERVWITGGIVLPALRSHLARRAHARLEEAVAAAEERLKRVLLGAPSGLPVQYRAAGGKWFSALRLREVPEVHMLLDGLPAAEARRLLQRSWVRRALGEVPVPDDPDLATVFSMIGRCDWVMR